MEDRSLEMTSGFRGAARARRSEAAVMVVEPTETVGEPHNRHRNSDQWLFVVSGEGEAVVEGERRDLRPGTLVLIIAVGEGHEIRNTTDISLEPLNVYVPPEYR